MPKYLIQATYTAQGAKGLLKEGGTGRRNAIKSLLKGMGGKLESFYYAFGKTDVYVIAEVPDNVAATAIGLAVNSSGAASCTTIPLITVEEVDAAAEKTVAYRAPGA